MGEKTQKTPRDDTGSWIVGIKGAANSGSFYKNPIGLMSSDNTNALLVTLKSVDAVYLKEQEI